MARARNIKPAFFLNELLAECDPLARLLFAGLWCAADREGRLADRPKRLKAEILPYDDCDTDSLLEELAQRGFIVRYKANDVALIAIPAFAKHQNPHHREGASPYPAPTIPELADGQASDEPRASRGQAAGEAAPEVGSAVLIPDSGFLIPDSVQEQPPAADVVAEKEPKAKDADLFPGVSKEVIRDFRSIRRAKSAPVTMTAMNGIKREAMAAGLTLHDALVMCCTRGWAGFEASWLSGAGGRRGAVSEVSRLPELTA